MYRHQDAAARPQRLNVQIEQILIGERLEDGHVDLAVDEVLDVVLEPQPGQDGGDVVVLRHLLALMPRCHLNHGGRHVVARISSPAA